MTLCLPLIQNDKKDRSQGQSARSAINLTVQPTQSPQPERAQPAQNKAGRRAEVQRKHSTRGSRTMLNVCERSPGTEKLHKRPRASQIKTARGSWGAWGTNPLAEYALAHSRPQCLTSPAPIKRLYGVAAIHRRLQWGDLVKSVLNTAHAYDVQYVAYGAGEQTADNSRFLVAIPTQTRTAYAAFHAFLTVDRFNRGTWKSLGYTWGRLCHR